MQTVYWPSLNTAALTVEPPSTTAKADPESTATEQQEPTKVEIPPGKTPEEMQQEAKDKEWLSIKHKFTWWYPWYRIHIKINVNPVIDVGFNPILPGGETYLWEGLEIFAAVAEEFIQELIIDVVTLFIEYIVAKALSMLPITWLAAATALAAKGVTQFWLLMKDWGNPTKMLAVSLVNFIIGLMAFKVSIGVAFIDALFNLVYGRTMSALYLLQNKLPVAAEPIQHIRTWIDAPEVIMDISFGISALGRYLDLIGVI
jgi:hypothetical protein